MSEMSPSVPLSKWVTRGPLNRRRLTPGRVLLHAFLILMAMIGFVPFAMLPWFFVYLVADVMMLAALGAALGAACSTPQDAQSLALFLMVPVMVPMFVEDMQFDGADGGAISWGDEVSDEAKAASPVICRGRS